MAGSGVRGMRGGLAPLTSVFRGQLFGDESTEVNGN